MGNFLGVPDVVWSGVIGSSIAFLGVWLSNKSNTDRLVQQLRHDAHEKATQRRAEVRKAVYLELAEQFALANAHIGAMSSVEPGNENSADALMPFHSASAKAQLVAGIQTADAIADLMATHTKFFLKAVAKLMPIHAMKFQIEAKTEQYEEARAEMKRVLSEMAAFTEAARTERDVFEALNRSFTIQKEAAAAATAARSDLYDAINALHRDYFEFTTSSLGAIMRASAPVMAAMRRELEIDGYDVDYESRLIKRFEQIEADVMQTASEFIDKTIGPSQAADVKRT